MKELLRWLDEKCDDLVEVRRYLHQYPEVSEEEYNTQAFLKYRLKTSWPDSLEEIGGTGLIVTYDSQAEGPNVLVRVDIDALPIEEKNEDLEYKSKNEGVSHKCGHDGHATMGLGLAHYISQHRPKLGKVYILFQPAEENAQGAKAVLEDDAFPKDVDFAFALHNIPGMPAGAIINSSPHFSASVKSAIIRWTGKMAHAAEPEQGKSPDRAISEVLQFATEKTNNAPEGEDFQLLTPIYVAMGQKAYGTLPSKGEVHFTLRCWAPERMQRIVEELEAFVNELSKQEELEYEMEYLEDFPAVVNDSQADEICRWAAQQLDYEIIERERPFRWGEDFGVITQQVPGMMFGLGAGRETPPLHDDHYDFPDAILPNGIALFAMMIEKAQNTTS